MSRIGKLPDRGPVRCRRRYRRRPGDREGTQGHPVAHRRRRRSLVERNDDVLDVKRPDDERQSKALHGLTRTLINNMVVGVTEGFEKKLEIVGVGYRVLSKGPTQLEFQLGYSHPIVFDAPEGITFSVEGPTKLGVAGIDKQLVGEVAANIRKLRKPEPYKGKGVRYAGEHIRRKVGKAGKWPWRSR